MSIDTVSDLPWFKLWVDDWINSTTIAAFSAEQESAYLRLLIRQWMANDGYLPTNTGTLANWARISADKWKRVGKPVLDRCFVRENGHYFNRKLRDQWEEARAIQKTKRRAGKAGAKGRWEN